MATKKVKDTLVRCSNTMTESQYLSWIRSALRSKSLRWGPRNDALKLARRAYVGPNKLQKWEYLCTICQKYFLAKEVVVDHHPHAAGSILSCEDIGPFANRLFCEVDGLRVLCSPCHDIHTLAEKMDISFEAARVEKKIIAMTKLPVPELLKFLSDNGYTGVAVSNATKRRECVSEILRGDNS